MRINWKAFWREFKFRMTSMHPKSVMRMSRTWIYNKNRWDSD